MMKSSVLDFPWLRLRWGLAAGQRGEFVERVAGALAAHRFSGSQKNFYRDSRMQ